MSIDDEPKCEHCGCPSSFCVCEYAQCWDCDGEGFNCGCWDDMARGSCEGGEFCPDRYPCFYCKGAGHVRVEPADTQGGTNG